ncbi:gamma-glutamyl-gamma-aminobutyrate hydrolase family protein [Enterococcus faecalis]|uniref:gamma-glutamyl-gamma-aminobutyrate hydrolase family protein n=1 Tax=Enterococcus faecalis TaxID=1351 RepID=UPI002431E881|nr:gamma-glutamyl-gamma-aminobutyrate hydrolase family protein [Enterococcus faecalis]
MTKKIIGIAGNQLLQAAEVFHGNQVTYTPQGFVSAVQAAGGVPLVLPIGPKELAATYIQQIDKLLLAGGQDVAPEFYGQEPHIKLEETNRDRDEFELALIEEALKQNKPIFAVCRGMQLVNVALGGTLYQDLSMYPQWSVKHGQQPTQPIFATHRIDVEPDSQLSNIYGTTGQVNSYHHQALHTLGKDLRVTAWSSDGLAEAVESTNEQQPLLAVQCHPELMYARDAKSQALFNYFVQKL